MKDLNLNKEERESIINCLCDYMGSCDFQLRTKNNSLDKSIKKEYQKRISFCSKMVKKIENSMKKIKVLFPFVEAGFGHIMATKSIADAFEKKYGDYCEVERIYFYKQSGDKAMIEFEKKLCKKLP